MRFDKVVRGGTVWSGSGAIEADVAISGETVAAVGRGLEAEEVIDATGMDLFPGAIDAHVHLQLPVAGTVTVDDFEGGTRAAACGGVTTVLDFAMQERGGSILAAIEARRAEADGKVCVDYGLHAGITDLTEAASSELSEVVASGVPTFKMFMIYRDRGLMADDGALYAALERARELGAQVGVHAESEGLLELFVGRYKRHPDRARLGARAHALSRPAVTEWEAVQRAVTLAEVSGGRLYVVHTSAGRSVEIVREARRRGVEVYAETCPQYLLLDESVFEGERGHLFATCPQVKTRADSEALWAGLADGAVQVLATDTCSFTVGQKAAWGGDFWRIPFGLPGVETLVPLTYTHGPAAGRLSVEGWVRLVSETPARLFGLYPRKGVIAPGSDADILVWDRSREVTLSAATQASRSDYCPYEGWVTKGAPHLTLSRGKVVARDGAFVGRAGWGRYVRRDPGGRLER